MSLQVQSSQATGNYRIRLWRNTIALFSDLRSIDFRGPFKKAGYRIGVIEPRVDDSNRGGAPDLVCLKAPEWAIIELTLNEESKKCQLDIYENLGPTKFVQWLGNVINGPPNVICSRLMNTIDDGGHCQIFVGDSFDVKNSERISDLELRSSLESFVGTPMRSLPDISIQLLPEMASKPNEIRRGVLNIIMQLPGVGYPGMSTGEIVDRGLDIIAEYVSESARNSLIKSVDVQLVQLVQSRMKDYIIYDTNEKGEHVFKFKENVNIHHPATKEKINRILREWVGETTPQKGLFEFG